MFSISLDERLHIAPITTPRRILDLGTGTGIWAVEIAEKFPNASVIGNDLSAIQPRWVPPNLSFEVDDIEAEWNYKIPFDFIHSRHLDYSIANWDRLIKQCFRFTRPGGWCEWQECEYNLYSEDGTFIENNAVDRWVKGLIEAATEMGRVASPGLITEKYAREAGFVNITHEVHKIPMTPWAKETKYKEIGAFNLAGILENLEGVSLALYTRVLGWSPEEVYAFLAQVRKEFKNPGAHGVCFVLKKIPWKRNI
ncbi:hypothetical protein MMC20_000845 [Loxospora ochrophaea]|nr:hypothetical protein [Loxospora ochrophaea]